MQKKALGKILSVVRCVPTIPNKRVKRIPVQAAQLGKCGFGTRRPTLNRKQHHAPPSGAKSASGIRWRMIVRVQIMTPVFSLDYHRNERFEIRDFQPQECTLLAASPDFGRLSARFRGTLQLGVPNL